MSLDGLESLDGLDTKNNINDSKYLDNFIENAKDVNQASLYYSQDKRSRYSFHLIIPKKLLTNNPITISNNTTIPENDFFDKYTKPDKNFSCKRRKTYYGDGRRNDPMVTINVICSKNEYYDNKITEYKYSTNDSKPSKMPNEDVISNISYVSVNFNKLNKNIKNAIIQHITDNKLLNNEDYFIDELKKKGFTLHVIPMKREIKKGYVMNTVIGYEIYVYAKASQSNDITGGKKIKTRRKIRNNNRTSKNKKNI